MDTRRTPINGLRRCASFPKGEQHLAQRVDWRSLASPQRAAHTGAMDRAQLADFLRSRREAIQPGDVGITRGPRRRTSGLRREEVAQLTGMSTDYYARLEQQRGPQPSEQMVAAMARGLRLTLDERDHLFRLAGHTAPTRVRRSDHVSPTLMKVLDRLDDTPAQVMSDLGETLVQNRLAVALLGIKPSSPVLPEASYTAGLPTPQNAPSTPRRTASAKADPWCRPSELPCPEATRTAKVRPSWPNFSKRARTSSLSGTSTKLRPTRVATRRSSITIWAILSSTANSFSPRTRIKPCSSSTPPQEAKVTKNSNCSLSSELRDSPPSFRTTCCGSHQEVERRSARSRMQAG